MPKCNQWNKKGLLILLIPLVLTLLYIIKTCKLPSIDGLLSLLGAFYGGVISLVGIAWQMNFSKRQEENNKKQGLEEYIKYILEKNLEDRSVKDFNIQKLISFSTKWKEINYSGYILFDETFISDNLKTIVSSDYGKEILEIFYEMKELNTLIERIKNDFPNRSDYINNLTEFINKGCKDNVKGNLAILESISSIIESINTNNSTILISLQDNLKKKLDNGLFAEIEFRDLKITRDNIDEIISSKKIKTDSVRVNEIFIDFLDGINSNLSSDPLYRKDLKNIYEEVREIVIIYKKINGKSFKISEKIDELINELPSR